MVTEALAVFCTFAVHTAHGTGVATTVSADKPLVTSAHAVMAVTMSGADKGLVNGGACAHVACSPTPAWHTLALSVIANAMAGAVLGAVFLAAVLTNEPFVALTFHLNTLSVIGAPVWTRG